jgi:F0F1-type ATP synthase assembly protein I
VGETPSDKYKRIRQLGLLSAIPLILAAAPLIGYFIGQRIDRALGTNPVFMFVFLGLGFAAGVRETILLIRKAEDED